MRSLFCTLPLAATALLLLSVALTHALAPDNHLVLATLHAGIGWWLLPAYPLSPIALLLGRKRSAAVYAAVAVAHLSWVAPGHTPPLRIPEGSLCRVGSANLLWINPSPEQLTSELLRLDADIWCVQELTAPWAAQLDAWPSAARWPHRALSSSDGSFGIGLLSERPFDEIQQLDLGGVPMLLARIDGITVACAHTLPPRTLDLTRQWHQQMAALGDLLAGIEGPLVLAGDLNASRHHPSLVSLAEIAGLHDAHAEVGRASALSWPAPPYFIGIPILRLDHVLLSEDLQATEATEGAASGSDHRPVVASFVRRSEGGAIRAAPGAGAVGR